jgi:hypothetical protein
MREALKAARPSVVMAANNLYDGSHVAASRALRAIDDALSGDGQSVVVTEEMVTRFLTWPLPASVCADEVATIPNRPHRTGTTLLTAIEARQMLEHVLNGPRVEKQQ